MNTHINTFESTFPKTIPIFFSPSSTYPFV
jgi:hypothetical protein